MYSKEMETIPYELQTSIIRNILNIRDINFLLEIQKLILSNEKIKVLSEFEKDFISESKTEIDNGSYCSNEEVFNEMKTWLHEK
jgi:hypothetical protein